MLNNQRPVGVTIPEQQLRTGKTGPPNTVTNIVPLQPVGVQYYDQNGVQKSTVVYRMGNDVYFDANAERWQASLSRAADFIQTAVNAEFAVLQAEPAPGLDTVDVLAKEGLVDAETTTQE